MSGSPTGTGLSYSWAPTSTLSCSFCQNPVAFPVNTTDYYLMITDSLGCKTSDMVTITVDKNATLYIPDVFSPNGDGENDFFFVQGKGIAFVSVVVYDRWGEKMFESLSTEANDKLLGWNGYYKGKPVNAAVFIYVVTGRYIGGAEFSKAGDFTLVR